MFSSIYDVIMAVIGVIAAPFFIQSVIRTRSTLGRVAELLAGAALLAVFLWVWGKFGRDPLQIGYCWLNPNAHSCAAAPLNERRLVGAWRVDSDKDCIERHELTVAHGRLRVHAYNTTFVEKVEQRDDNALTAVIETPSQSRGQRFQYRMNTDGSLDVVPLYGGETEKWVRCVS